MPRCVGRLRRADRQLSLVPFDDAGGDPQAQTGAVQILGGEEGLEDPPDGGVAHAVAGIGDGDAHAGPFVSARPAQVSIVRAQQQPAARAHGVDGIRDQVVEHLANVVLEAEHPGPGAVVDLDPDVRVGEASRVEPDDCVDQIAGPDQRGRDRLAMEAQGLGGDLRDARQLRLRHVDVHLQGLGQRRVERDEVEQVGDGFERIVDLMRDGARQTADGGQLLALHQSFLRPLLVSDLDGGRGRWPGPCRSRDRAANN